MNPKHEEIIFLIADYVANKKIINPVAYDIAKLCLQDALGCAILSLKFPECQKLLGPVVPDTVVPRGSRVPGTSFVLDPVQAAFNLGTMIRFLDYNDTWLAKEWAHPSDNLGAILSVSDYLSQNGKKIKMKDVLTAMIKAYEIQGILALSNSFNEIGFDHVIYVKIASAAVTTFLLGGNVTQIADTISNAWLDTGPLRTYRHFPNTGSRKSWAAGDQCMRAVHFSLLTMRGEMGYHTPLSAKKWGMFEVLFDGKPFILAKPLGSYVMENILFKVSFPAEFHAQTAVEAAIQLAPKVKNRLNEITKIKIQTQEPAIRIIDKKGPLKNAADRDHCIQYMVATALIKGNLTEDDYLDKQAQNPLIDYLRNKCQVIENFEFTKEYYDLDKRAIANTITIYFEDGSVEGPLSIFYPLGHASRRKESIPFLNNKFKTHLLSHYSSRQAQEIINIFNESSFFEIETKEFIKIFM